MLEQQATMYFMAIAAVMMINGLAISEACPTGWLEFDQACYKLFTESKLDYIQARKKCQCLGGYLATPNSEQESTFIGDLFHEAEKPDTVNLWIGCRREDGIGWSSAGVCCRDDLNDPNPFRMPFLPNDENRPGNCFMLKTYQGKYWGRFSYCSKSKYTMCEVNNTLTARHSCTKSFHAKCSAAFTDAAGRPMDFCLTGHAYKTTPMSPLQCCLACIKDSRCRSFNMMSEKVCQLNNMTVAKAKKKDSIVQMGNCVVYKQDFA